VACFLRSLLMVTVPRYTVHDASPPRSMFLPLVSFLASFAWVSFYSFVISNVVGRFVTMTNVGGGYYGVILVCIGAEIPDTIQCLTVAKRGYGSMAISNVIGSQVINILIGLGAPWTISAAFGNPIRVTGHENLTGAATFLLLAVVVFTSLLIVPVCLGARKAFLVKWKGWVLFGTYFCVIFSYTAWYFMLLHDEGRRTVEEDGGALRRD